MFQNVDINNMHNDTSKGKETSGIDCSLPFCLCMLCFFVTSQLVNVDPGESMCLCAALWGYLLSLLGCSIGLPVPAVVPLLPLVHADTGPCQFKGTVRTANIIPTYGSILVPI